MLKEELLLLSHDSSTTSFNQTPTHPSFYCLSYIYRHTMFSYNSSTVKRFFLCKSLAHLVKRVISTLLSCLCDPYEKKLIHTVCNYYRTYHFWCYNPWPYQVSSSSCLGVLCWPCSFFPPCGLEVSTDTCWCNTVTPHLSPLGWTNWMGKARVDNCRYSTEGEGIQRSNQQQPFHEHGEY